MSGLSSRRLALGCCWALGAFVWATASSAAADDVELLDSAAPDDASAGDIDAGSDNVLPSPRVAADLGDHLPLVAESEPVAWGLVAIAIALNAFTLAASIAFGVLVRDARRELARFIASERTRESKHTSTATLASTAKDDRAVPVESRTRSTFRVRQLSLAALGSRNAEKQPQDAAASVWEPSTGAAAVAIADGVSEVRDVSIEEVRAYATALVAHAVELVSERSDWEREPERALREWISGFGEGMRGRAVLGGCLWLPASGECFLFAIGNVAVVVLDGDNALICVGSESIFVGPGAKIAPETMVSARIAPTSDRLDVLVLSDGAHAPPVRGGTAIRRTVGEKFEPTLERWYQTIHTRVRAVPDMRMRLLRSNPPDDSTLAHAILDRAARPTEERGK